MAWAYQEYLKIADLFHVTPTSERNRINQHGLLVSDPYWENATPEDWAIVHGPDYRPPSGVYGWPSMDQAQTWRDSTGEPDYFDIWRMPGQGLPDPDHPSAQYVPHAVRPELAWGPEQWIGHKFFTDEHQHAKHKALYNIKQGFPPKSGAADPIWLQNWMNQHGPYLFHGTTVRAAPDILKDGLYPHDDPRWGSSQSEHHNDFFYPRPGHVYMGTQKYIHDNGYNAGRVGRPKTTLKIDLRKLDPRNLNPDEDHFLPYNRLESHPVVQNIMEHDPPPSQDEYEAGNWQGLEDDLGGENLGSWADRAQLGIDPEESHYSMGMGSIAHLGHIPPSAIFLAGPDEQSPWSQPMPTTAKTDAHHWEGKMFHGANRGLLGPVRTPFWTTSHKPEALGFGDTVHPVSVRFKNPMHLFGDQRQILSPSQFDSTIAMAQGSGFDGIVAHHPEDYRDPSDPYPERTWAIALDPGTVVQGHDHSWPYGSPEKSPSP